MKKLALLVFLLFLTGCTNIVDIYEDARTYAYNNYDNVYQVSCLSPAYFTGSEKYDLVQDKKGLCFILASDEGMPEELFFFGSPQNTKKADWDPFYTYPEIEPYLDEFTFRYHNYYYQFSYSSDEILLAIDIKNNNDLFISVESDELIYYEVDFAKTLELNAIYSYYKEVDLARFIRNLRP